MRAPKRLGDRFSRSRADLLVVVELIVELKSVFAYRDKHYAQTFQGGT